MLKRVFSSSSSYRRFLAGHRASQDGSAFLVALIALLVLTMLGLSLSFVTQTEMLVGATERITQRVFYGAESGISIAAARVLVSHDKRSVSVLLNDATNHASFTGVPLRSQVELAPVVPVAAPPCNYCQINSEGEYKTNSYFKVNHAITVRASLVGPKPTLGDRPVLAQKMLSTMIDVQPWSDYLPPPSSEDTQLIEF